MHRFFLSPEEFNKDNPEVKGPDVQHMSKVLRLKPGDPVEILDGAGRAARAVIQSLGREEVICRKAEEFDPGSEPPLKVILVQGLAKGEKMDITIQKCTELGVAGIIPAICHRSVVRLDSGKFAEKQVRWQRVAMEAAKQCRRAAIPVVSAPKKLSEVLTSIPGGAAAYMPWEEEKCCPLKEALPPDSPGTVYIFIGPEGGFETYEVEEARGRGVVTVTLGPRILRTETAGPVCVALVMHKWGDLG